MDRDKILAEGKTKIIWKDPERDGFVLVENKSDITAEDGARRDVIKGKGALATTTTSNCFRLLEVCGITTHFDEQVDETTFRARELPMLPIECVARRIATGSYLKRETGVEEGTRFEDPKVEFFWKDDDAGDPMMLWSEDRNGFSLLQAKVRSPSAPIGFVPATDILTDLPFDFTEGVLAELERITRDVFLSLEEAWAEQGVTLVDFKIEFGVDLESGLVIVADVIDNDSWRLWPGGDKAARVDKDNYRQFGDLETVLEKYQWVAKASSQFFNE